MQKNRGWDFKIHMNLSFLHTNHPFFSSYLTEEFSYKICLLKSRIACHFSSSTFINSLWNSHHASWSSYFLFLGNCFLCSCHTPPKKKTCFVYIFLKLINKIFTKIPRICGTKLFYNFNGKRRKFCESNKEFWEE